MSPADRLALRQYEAGGAWVIEGCGELDLDTAPLLREQILWALNDSGQGRLVLELTGITYCGEAGLQLLLGGYRRARDRGIEFRIVASDHVERKIRQTGLSDWLPVRGTVEEALG